MLEMFIKVKTVGTHVFVLWFFSLILWDLFQHSVSEAMAASDY